MAWSLVGVGTVATPVTATPLTLTEPAGVANGDLLVACIASRTTATTAVTSTGWTAVGSQNNNNTLTTGSALASGTMLYRVRSGTPTLAFTLPTGISVAMGCIVAYRGNAATTPLDVSTAVTTAISTTAVSVTGLTTTQDNDLIVAMAAGGQEAAWSAFNNVGLSNGWSTTDKSVNVTLSGSDKIATTSSNTTGGVRSAQTKVNGTAGKYYAEFLLGATAFDRHGIMPLSGSLADSAGPSFQVSTSSGNVQINGAFAGSVGTALVAADVLCVAWDAGAEKVWFRKNGGNWNNTAGHDPATDTGGFNASFAASTAHALWCSVSASGSSATVRTEIAEFTQTVPSGFSAWVTVSLAALTASGATDTTTAPSTTAWIERADSLTTTGADASLAIFDAVRTGTGATGNLTATASVAAGHVIIAGAFKIAASAVSVSADVTGQAATVSVGTATATGKATASVTGQQATAAVGTATVVGKATATLTGQEIACAVGSVTVTAIQKATADVTGQQLTALVNGVSVIAGGSVSVSLTGQAVTASVGTATVTAIAGTVGVWNGTSWVQKPAKVWTGSAWVQKPVKTWNGTSWAA